MANRISESSPTDAAETAEKPESTGSDTPKASSSPVRRTPKSGSGKNGVARKLVSKTGVGDAGKLFSKSTDLKSRTRAVAAARTRAVTQVAPAPKDLQTSAADAASTVRESAVQTIRQHAIPAALIGAGLAWYLLSTKPARTAEARLLEQAKRAAGVVGEALTEVSGTAGGVYTHAADTTRTAVSTAAGSVSHAAGTVASAVHDGTLTIAGYAKNGVTAAGDAIRSGATVVGQTTRAGYQAGQRVVADSWENHPLAVGASLLAAGVTAGMFLPAPRQSSALIRRASADLSRKVSTKATELLGKGRDAIGASSTPAPTGNGRSRSRGRTAG